MIREDQQGAVRAGISLKDIQSTQIRLIEPFSKFYHEQGFIVYKSNWLPQYRLANGIQILSLEGHSLADWEKIFDKFFERKTYSHQLFTFFRCSQLNGLLNQAKCAGYREVNVYPLKVCYKNIAVENSLSSEFSMGQVKTENDWEMYRDFKREADQNAWTANEGFGMVRHLTEFLDMKRFFITTKKTQKIISSLGIFKYNGLARIENVQTHPSFRGRGLAGHLLRFAINYTFSDPMLKGVVLTSANQIAEKHIYDPLGFITTGETVELMTY